MIPSRKKTKQEKYQAYSNQAWYDPDGTVYQENEIIEILKNYSLLGGIIFVGTDSMLNSQCCIFSSAIALHNRDIKIARYFFKKRKLPATKYKELRVKIFKEVELSINVSNLIKAQIPDANIELHVDVGTDIKCATSKLVDSVKGWVIGSGYIFKSKPFAWAASSVADWHTK